MLQFMYEMLGKGEYDSRIKSAPNWGRMLFGYEFRGAKSDNTSSERVRAGPEFRRLLTDVRLSGSYLTKKEVLDFTNHFI